MSFNRLNLLTYRIIVTFNLVNLSLSEEKILSKRFQILSLSGGGYRGLYTASVLSHLEETIGDPIAKRFDLLAGTSIGGIIVLALALEVPAKEILSAFESQGASIFPITKPTKSRIKKCLTYWNLAKAAKYRSEELKKTIISIVGESTIMGDLLHPTIVPAVNVTKGSPQFFKTPHHKNFRMDWQIPVWKVAMATSAAPTIFPLAEINNSLYADGGLYANSPEMVGLHEAQHFMNAPKDSIHLLSVGTTETSVALPISAGVDLGWLGWGTDLRLLNIIAASQEQCSTYMLGHTLGDRFIRINEKPSSAQQAEIGLDIATDIAQKTLKALGTISAQRVLGQSNVTDFFNHNVSKTNFYYGKYAKIGESFNE